MVGEGAKRVLSEKRQLLAQAEINLGKAYSVILMGQGNKATHHSHGGRHVITIIIPSIVLFIH